jgi:hypothetical protein
MVYFNEQRFLYDVLKSAIWATTWENYLDFNET